MTLAIVCIIAFIVLFILFKIFKAFLKWLIIILLVVALVAFLTNPEASSHHQSLNEKIRSLNLKRIREKLVEVEDYKIFSLTKVKVKGDEKIVGVGAFGKVWYFDDLEDKLKKKIKGEGEKE